MNLSKKQVKALLEVMSSDTTRPVLMAAKVDKHDEETVLVAMDGYVLAELAAPELGEHVGKYLSRAELTKWYKLAGNKDQLTHEGIVEMLSTEEDYNYPEWQRLMGGLNQQPIDALAVNPKYLVTMNALADSTLTWKFNGHALKAEHERNTYLVMPLKG
ncbi:hypothetical protein [Mycobacteroides abscessus]|uniref:hypothetical protein n=1 Tax=Mycobacteroides abscessus TaxID=36809 RepID=UPI0012FFEFF3|nr:hypothetical protein [Mycobacteroides abscessus]